MSAILFERRAAQRLILSCWRTTQETPKKRESAAFVRECSVRSAIEFLFEKTCRARSGVYSDRDARKRRRLVCFYAAPCAANAGSTTSPTKSTKACKIAHIQKLRVRK